MSDTVLTCRVNDAPFACEVGATVADIVAQLADVGGVAVALNAQILPKSNWTTAIQAGDSLLIFEAIAGG